MIKHVVCFKLKEPTEENKQKAAQTILSMKENIDYLRGLEVGRDFLGSPRSYDVFLAVTLDDEEALETYQNDEYHCDVVKKYMNSVTEKSVSVDFEI